MEQNEDTLEAIFRDSDKSCSQMPFSQRLPETRIEIQKTPMRSKTGSVFTRWQIMCVCVETIALMFAEIIRSIKYLLTF